MASDSDETIRGAFTAPPTDEFDRPDATRVIATPRRTSTQQIVLAFVAVAAAGFLIGVASGAVTRNEPEREVLATRDVGPSGATIRFNSDQLRIPEGALSGVVRISVTRSKIDEQVRVEAREGRYLTFAAGTLDAYRFEPSDITFNKPVELTFRLPAGARNGTVFAKRGERIVLLSGMLDIDRDTAAVKVRDFRFGVAQT